MAEIKITKENFESEVLNSKIPVLLDFYAVWCGPCKMLSPVLARLAEKLDGKVTVGKINVDEEPELAQKFGVQSIPTLVVMKDGKPARQSVGFLPEGEILELLK